MAVDRRNLKAYGVGEPLISMAPEPIVSQRPPTNRDRAEIGTIWIDVPNDDSYILTSVVANVSTWINSGGGGGVFNTLAVTTTATIGTTLLVGGATTLSALGLGVVQSTAAGLLSSSDGTDGQVLIASTGAAAPVWNTLTAGGGITIVEGAGTITISNPGATGTTFGTDLGGPVAPTVGGLTTFAGGTNITTDGTVANVVTWDLDDDVTLAGFLSVGDTFDMLAGDFTVEADSDAARTIFLHADGGSNETIDIYSVQGTSNTSIYLHSDLGGVALVSGNGTANALTMTTTNAAGGITIASGTSGTLLDSTGAISLDSADASNFSVTGATNDLTLASAAGSVNITAGEAIGDAILIDATNAAGGIDFACGTGGFNVVSTNGTIAFESGTANINVGVDAVAHTVTLGNAIGASAVAINSGTGDITATATLGSVVLEGTEDADNAIRINASHVNGGIDVDCGVTGFNLLATGGTIEIIATQDVGSTILLESDGGINETIRIHCDQGMATNSITIDSDDGGIYLLAGGAGSNVIELRATAGGVKLDGRLAAADAIVIDASDAAGGIDMDCGTAGFDLLATGGSITLTSTENAADAIYLHANAGITESIHLLSTQGTAAAAIHLQSLVGGVNLTGGIAAAGAITIVASDAAGGIDIDYGTGGCTVDGANGAFTMQTGTGNISIGADAADHDISIGAATGVNDMLLTAGTGGMTLAAAGLVDVVPVTDTQAATACTASANVGVCTFTGITTAAAASQVFTITNTLCTVGSAILVSASNLGANDAQMTVTRVTPGAGSFTVTLTNNGAAALNGDVIITFWMIAV